MLVLNRKLGQQILIDGRISVKVVDIRRGRVRLGITCPDDVRILRAELLEPRESRLSLFADESAAPETAGHRQTRVENIEAGYSGKAK